MIKSVAMVTANTGSRGNRESATCGDMVYSFFVFFLLFSLSCASGRDEIKPTELLLDLDAKLVRYLGHIFHRII